MVRPMGYFSKKRERISTFVHREVCFSRGEPRERTALRELSLHVSVCHSEKKMGGTEFNDRRISLLLQSACSLRNSRASDR